MATQGDDLVAQGGKVCAICSAIASVESYSTSCIVSCCSKKNWCTKHVQKRSLWLPMLVPILTSIHG